MEYIYIIPALIFACFVWVGWLTKDGFFDTDMQEVFQRSIQDALFYTWLRIKNAILMRFRKNKRPNVEDILNG